MGILENKEAREAANFVIDFIDENEVPKCARVRFFQIIRDKLIERCPLPKSDGPKFEPMNDSERICFGTRLMPFGQHLGCPVDEIPITYLQWLVTNNRNARFVELVNRYLASPRIQSEQ